MNGTAWQMNRRSFRNRTLLCTCVILGCVSFRTLGAVAPTWPARIVPTTGTDMFRPGLTVQFAVRFRTSIKDLIHLAWIFCLIDHLVDLILTGASKT